MTAWSERIRRHRKKRTSIIEQSAYYRGVLQSGFSRPEYGNISLTVPVGRDPAPHEIISVSRGNPDLKPAQAVNLDQILPGLVENGVNHPFLKGDPYL